MYEESFIYVHEYYTWVGQKYINTTNHPIKNSLYENINDLILVFKIFSTVIIMIFYQQSIQAIQNLHVLIFGQLAVA